MNAIPLVRAEPAAFPGAPDSEDDGKVDPGWQSPGKDRLLRPQEVRPQLEEIHVPPTGGDASEILLQRCPREAETDSRWLLR